jgi:hypothetical protein
MESEDRTLLKGLLEEQRLVALGLLVEGEPVVGLLPFVVSEDRGALYVQASGLARHSHGLVAGAPFSGVIHRPDTPGEDALRTPRVALEGVVHPLEGESPERAAAVRSLVERFPSAAMTLALPDFKVYRLELTSGRLIGGFGRASSLAASDFRDLARA